MGADRSESRLEWSGEGAGGFLGRLLHEEATGGIVLTASLIAAVLWASTSPSSYAGFVTRSVRIPAVPAVVVHDIGTLVTNLLMIMFFAAIGLEIGRERAVGSLRETSTAAMPVIAALGGMAMAAMVYLITASALHAPGSLAGWGVPMATDVAFTLGALSLLGSKVSTELRVFLLTLAVADDVASVIILAFVAHQGPHVSALAAGLLGIAACSLLGITLLLRRTRLGWPIYVLVGMLLWLVFGSLGIEPTLAGVVVGAAVPTGDERRSPGVRLERGVAPLSMFIVLPLFALVAGGVDLSSRPWNGQSGLLVALIAARSIGKLIGVAGGVAIAVATGIGRLPVSTSRRQMAGAGLLCGIGFTVPLLFAQHAFAREPQLLTATKLGLLIASLLCALVGLLVVGLRSPRRPT